MGVSPLQTLLPGSEPLPPPKKGEELPFDPVVGSGRPIPTQELAIALFTGEKLPPGIDRWEALVDFLAIEFGQGAQVPCLLLACDTQPSRSEPERKCGGPVALPKNSNPVPIEDDKPCSISVLTTEVQASSSVKQLCEA